MAQSFWKEFKDFLQVAREIAQWAKVCSLHAGAPGSIPNTAGLKVVACEHQTKHTLSTTRSGQKQIFPKFKFCSIFNRKI